MTEHSKSILWGILVAMLVGCYMFLPTLPMLQSSASLQICTDHSFDSSEQAIESRMQHYQNSLSISALRESWRGHYVHLLGDSTMRETYYELADLLSRKGIKPQIRRAEEARREKTKHNPQVSRIGSSQMQFSWAPFLHDVQLQLRSLLKLEFPPQIIIVSVGLHDLLYNNETGIHSDLESFVGEFQSAYGESEETNGSPTLKTAKSPASLVYLTSPYIVNSGLSGHRQQASQFRNEKAMELTSHFRSTFHSFFLSPQFASASITALTSRKPTIGDDGLHDRTAASNTALALASLTSCHFGIHPFMLTPSQVMLVLLFLIIVASYFYNVIESYRLYSSGYSSLLPTSNGMPHSFLNSYFPTQRNSPATSFIAASLSHPTYLAFMQLFAILLFIFLMDSDYRISWWLIADKTYNRDFFIFLVLIIAAFAYFASMKSSQSPSHSHTTPPSSNSTQTDKLASEPSATTVTASSTAPVPLNILNRDQTEEWKGWMQILFVLYHYFADKEMYNMIRVFIAAYVWLTGYGNFLFFHKFGDYSVSRLLKMLFRLNFLVFFLCLALNREYMQYYVCALHTTFFLLVYLVMMTNSSMNKSSAFLYFKFFVTFILLVLIFDIPSTGLFRLMFSKFSLFYWDNSLHEWDFRSTLDHFATLFGMIAASQLPKLERFYTFVEKQPPQLRFICTAISIGVCAVAIYFWYTCVYVLDKFKYNTLNPYTSIIPIATYVFLRNFTSYLRNHYLFLFTWCGRITLETYLLQFHVWLSDDAATIIQYLPSDYPLLNFVVSSCIYIYLSSKLFAITNVVSEWFLPKNYTSIESIQRCLQFAALLLGLYILSHFIILLIWV